MEKTFRKTKEEKAKRKTVLHDNKSCLNLFGVEHTITIIKEIIVIKEIKISDRNILTTRCVNKMYNLIDYRLDRV
jgi:hypothetical protein